MASDGTSLGEISNVIESVVRSRFPADDISSVIVEPDIDSDGDRVLRVTVVFDSQGKVLDAYKMAGLVRHLRARLADTQTDLFPLVSFIAKNELAKSRRESV